MLAVRSVVKPAIWAAGIISLVVVSLLFLHAPYYGYVWRLQASGFTEILPTTGWAAVRVWTFWGIATAIIAELILRADPEIGLFDAIFGGAAGAWIFAYVAGNFLGPIGLFRTWTLWSIVLAAIVALARKPPHLRFRPPSTGLKLAMLACALLAIGVLPMQLGSPVPPFMDILNNPASAQRVMTFHRYFPWDNDPYGHWGPSIQTPGLELFYALLALGSATPLAVLAETAATLPMMCLIVLATWRLGRTLISDAAGGMAALLLFLTTIFMRGVQMRGTAVAFVLVIGGLALLLDRERRPLRTGLGVILLGAAFASNAIDGALGFSTAVAAVALDLPERDWRNLAREALCLAGALLLAVPEFAVALVVRLPYPVLPAVQFAGIAVIYFAARGVTPRRAERRAATHWPRRGLLAATFAMFAFFPSGVITTVHNCFPILTLLCMGGLLLAAVGDYRHSGGIWIAGLALLIADLALYAITAALKVFPDPQVQFGLTDIILKLQEYWSPFFLVFPAAVLFDWVSRHLSRPMPVALLLVLVIFPWTTHPEFDISYNEQPLADQWAVNWAWAKVGGWGNSPDPRWLQSPAEFALIRKLCDEIRAGRITPATHVIHVAPDAVMWRDELLFSLYTGIDDDLYLIDPGEDLSLGAAAGSRLHPATRLPQALAQKPAYLAIHRQAPAWLKLPPPGYEEIFHQGGVCLFRRAASAG